MHSERRHKRSLSQLKIDGNVVTVDPHLLFQRMISATRENAQQNELKDYFTYELTTRPASLFGIDTLIIAATKPQLAKAIWGHFILCSASILGESKYVLDALRYFSIFRGLDVLVITKFMTFMSSMSPTSMFLVLLLYLMDTATCHQQNKQPT